MFSCTSQQYTINDLPDTQLVFGRGGGFTGEVVTYTLLENGQLFKHSSLTKEYKEMTKINKKTAKTYFKTISDLKLADQSINQPGNMYYFIEEVEAETKNRVTWGSNEYQIAEEFISFYKEINASIQ